MIVSRRHRFVFIKTRKTASTSVEVYLRRFCGPADIVTPVTPIDERDAVAQGLAPRNYSDDKALEARYADLARDGRLDAAAALHEAPFRFRNHMSAAAIREAIGARDFDASLVFSIERHPYDKAISLATFDLRFAAYQRGEAAPPAASAVLELIERRVEDGSIAAVANWPLYTIDGRVAAAAMIRYESLEKGLAAVLRKLGLDDRQLPGLPRLKAGLRPATLNADALSRRQKAAIARACRPEFDAFGYEP